MRISIASHFGYLDHFCFKLTDAGASSLNNQGLLLHDQKKNMVKEVQFLSLTSSVYSKTLLKHLD